MERKDEQKQPGEEREQPMAQDKDKNKRKPEEQTDERDNTVGKVPDPQGEDTKGDRSQP